MSDTATYMTYIMAFAAELAAALSSKVYDPAAYVALLGGALVGAFFIGASTRRGLVLAGCSALVIVAAITIESDYFRSPVSPQVRASLAFIYLIGVAAGSGLGWCFSRTSAKHP